MATQQDLVGRRLNGTSRSLRDMVLAVSLLCADISAAGDVLSLSATRHVTERKLVEGLYARELAEARSMAVPGEHETAIETATVDLDADGRAEVIARFVHPYFCGSHGCTLIILRAQSDGRWKKIASATSHGHVEIHSERINGFRPISLDRGPRWQFRNGTYRPQD